MFPSSPQKETKQSKKLEDVEALSQPELLQGDASLCVSLPPSSPPTIISLLRLQLQRSVRRMERSAPPLLYLLSTPPLFISIENKKRECP